MNPLAPGLHYDVPAAVYHADPCERPSLSSGILRTLLSRSIEHAALEHPKLGGTSKTQTASMGFGSHVHALLAETDEVVVGSFSSYRTKEAQAWRDSVLALGKAPVLEIELEDARAVVAALRARAALGCTNSPFANHGRNEVTAIWEEDGIACRARFDRLVIDREGYADIWDWKTTKDVSPRAIERAVVSYGYHIQAAFYLRGLNAVLPSHAGRTSFIFVFVETAAPYAVRRVTLSPEYLQAGMREVNRGIAAWKSAIDANEFTAPNTETLELQLPAFLETDDEISAS